MQSANIFSAIPKDLEQEAFEEIINSGDFRIERIMSRGHSTPSGQWCDQDQDEWVIVLAGSAALLFEGSDHAITLKPGDYVNIPAHVKHKVEWTNQTEETIWLAVHYG